MMHLLTFCATFIAVLPFASAHSAFWHPSMWGFNVTEKSFPYDNRPVAPLRNKSFNQWWFHNHLNFPPNKGDFFELPAGGKSTAEIACNKGATSYFASSEGGDIRNPNNPNDVCPGSPSISYHTNGFDDLEGCALGIVYKDKIEDVKPEDFTIFSVNQTCVWTRFTEFQVPERMPECPEGGCICAFFWVHSPKAGGEENYMNGFRCNVTNALSTVPLAKPNIARRCGSDEDNKKQFSVAGNCTYGSKQPFYWLNDNSNMFEGDHSPPVYNDRYNFGDGAQNDIFEDSYEELPEPGVAAPLPSFNFKAGLDIEIKKKLKASLGMVTSVFGVGGNGGNNLIDRSMDDERRGLEVRKRAGKKQKAVAKIETVHRAFGSKSSRADDERKDTEKVDPRLFRRYASRSTSHSRSIPGGNRSW